MNIPEVDRWVSAEFERLAEIIQDYDPNLELRWIPPEMRVEQNERKNPYCIWDLRTNTPVMYASELEGPQNILARLFDIDNTKGDVLQKIQSQNAAVQAFQLKEQMDQMEEAKDLSAFAIGNTKSRWKHNGIIFDDEMRNQGTGRIILP